MTRAVLRLAVQRLISGSFTAFISFNEATICCAGFQWVITCPG